MDVERPSEEHVFTLSSMIRNRKSQHLSTFVAFVDVEKAFDRVNRDLLFYKMLKLGFSRKLLRCIRSIYNINKTCININAYITEYFTVQYGVRQGDCYLPLCWICILMIW